MSLSGLSKLAQGIPKIQVLKNRNDPPEKAVAGEDELKDFGAFKSWLGVNDPVAFLNTSTMQAGQAFVYLCKRYGMPEMLVWRLPTKEIIEFLLTVGEAFAAGMPYKMLEKKEAKKIMPTPDAPANVVGMYVDVISRSENGGCYVQISTEGSLKGITFFAPEASLGNIKDKARSINLND